eukprot:354518-Chlamydomonas_euryale.AAC.8
MLGEAFSLAGSLVAPVLCLLLCVESCNILSRCLLCQATEALTLVGKGSSLGTSWSGAPPGPHAETHARSGTQQRAAVHSNAQWCAATPAHNRSYLTSHDRDHNCALVATIPSHDHDHGCTSEPTTPSCCTTHHQHITNTSPTHHQHITNTGSCLSASTPTNPIHALLPTRQHAPNHPPTCPAAQMSTCPL